MELERQEIDLQRYSQIRDEIHDLTQTIPLEVKKLAETNKRMIAHFDVFKSLTLEVKEQIHDEISLACTDVAQQASKALFATTEKRLADSLTQFEQAIQNTEGKLVNIQKYAHKQGRLRGIVIAFLFLVGGIVLGYFIPSKNQPIFSKEIFRIYQWGHALQTVWPKLNEKEKKHLESLIQKRD